MQGGGWGGGVVILLVASCYGTMELKLALTGWATWIKYKLYLL